jgi:hypothetical protein
VVSADDHGAAGGLVVSFAPGSRIAGYRLEEQIGQGGMAVVFKAHDERLDRPVALKILAPTLAGDEGFQRRFIRESQAAAAIDDPHIVPVFAAGQADGALFIAMRYVVGGDAHSMLNREGPLPPGRVADIISPVASALDAAHRAGLVHRDVKPSNMLMDVLPGRPAHVYLSDFGLTKAVASTSGVTATGAVLGTLAYMSPEQIGDRPLDGRADQYSLACSAFQLLAGAPPFRRDEPAALLYAHLSESPPKLTSRRPELPPAVDGVLSRALAKAAGDRYASCGQFADALRDAFGLPPYRSGLGARPAQTHPPTEIAWYEPPALARDGEHTVKGAAALSPAPEAADTPPTHTSIPAAATDVITPAGQPAAGDDGGREQPRRRTRRHIVIAASILAAAGLATGFLLVGSQAPPITVPISVSSALPAVSGYVYVVYRGGTQADAEVNGEIKNASNGEIAELYAQQFPYQKPPVQVGSVILHPAGATARYEFQVTPTLATRYQVELLRSSTSSAPFARSATATIYVTANQTTGDSVACLRPVCTESIIVVYMVPPSLLQAELSKPLYIYFGVNLAPVKVPPEPHWLTLGSGHGHVILKQTFSSHEFIETVSLSFTIGDDALDWAMRACVKDTETADGFGLPGYHGCGGQRVKSNTAGYLG